MTSGSNQARATAVVDRGGLDALIAALAADGYEVVGPTVRDDAIVYDRIASTVDLPVGWTEEQDAGRYRLRRRDDKALFGYVVGPHSWKQFLFPSRLRLWSAERDEHGNVAFTPERDSAPRYAFLGVRSCDLHAIGIHDRVFLGGDYVDPTYERRREGAFIVAVNCGEAGGTCFCVSMGTGPAAESGYDLALTELLDGEPRYLVAAGSERGEALLARLPSAEPTTDDAAAAERAVANAAATQGRRLDTAGIKELLYEAYEHPRWEDVATRCLSCTNCTLVCPTCFCHSVSDTSDLAVEGAERWRSWDSCFTLDFSFAAGGSVRSTTRSRYRQWLTHKLATWIDQFDSSGCVGCGRCITWCPVGIDITEEVAAIRDTPAPDES